VVDSFRHEGVEQRPKLRTQSKFFTFLLQHPARITRRLERVPQVRQPQEPDSVLQIILGSNPKSDPAGIGNPMVLLGKPPAKSASWIERGRRMSTIPFV
jgi:hypothetical protein